MDFVIYVLEGCPYCNAALDLLQTTRQRFHKIVVAPSQKAQIKAKNGMDTFPQIFQRRRHNGKVHARLIGGYSALEALLRN